MDILKGFLIILVVLGHSLQYGFGFEYFVGQHFYDDYLFRYIYSFHMPLFMLVSGYLFYSSNKKPYLKMLVSKLKSIGIPLLSFVFVLYLMSVVDPDSGNRTLQSLVAGYIHKLFGDSMWFLLSCLYSMITVGTIEHLFNKRPYASTLILVVIVFLNFIIPDDFILATHKFVYPFFLIGYWMKKWNYTLERMSVRSFILFLFFLISLAILYVYDSSRSIYVSGYSIVGKDVITQLLNSALRFFAAVVVSIMTISCLTVIKLSGRIKHTVIWLGRNTLGIYGFQTIFFIVIMKAFKILGINLSYNILIVFAICTLVVALCSISIIITKKSTLLTKLFLGGR